MNLKRAVKTVVAIQATFFIIDTAWAIIYTKAIAEQKGITINTSIRDNVKFFLNRNSPENKALLALVEQQLAANPYALSSN